jgi:GntR family transcriptional regulator
VPARKYREIADSLRERIVRGEWLPGDVLPRMIDLAAEYEVSRNVIGAAIKVLEVEGHLWAVPRKGTVVQVPGARSRIQRGSVVVRDEGGTVLGMDTTPRGSYSFPSSAHGLRWTTHGAPARSLEPAPERVAELLDVEPGAEVLRRRRVTSPEGEPPYQISDTWIHPAAVDEAPRVADEQPGPGGYLDRLEEAGHGPMSWREIARSRMPNKEEATLLQIPVDRAVMEIARVGVSARTGAAIEVTLCVIPGDRVEVVTQIQRAQSARRPHDPT